MNLLTKLRRRFLPVLDPRYVDQMRSRFDIGGGYEDYHAFCQSQLACEIPATLPPLLQQGYEALSVMDAKAATELKCYVEKNVDCAVSRRKSQHLREYAIDDDDEFRHTLLDRIISTEFNDLALRFFESEYFVHELSVTCATPSKKPCFNSFRWHCDRGPRMHLKLIVYLSDYSEHEGNTEFLDLESTRAIATTGYVYAPVRTRLADLSELAKQAKTRYAPWSTELRAGEGIAFQPNRVLHRGLLPRRGSRYVVTACLQPSPIPWREALKRFIPPPAGNDVRWHEHAQELKSALAVDPGSGTR